jgi:hypothetical protein
VSARDLFILVPVVAAIVVGWILLFVFVVETVREWRR